MEYVPDVGFPPGAAVPVTATTCDELEDMTTEDCGLEDSRSPGEDDSASLLLGYPKTVSLPLPLPLPRPPLTIAGASCCLKSRTLLL